MALRVETTSIQELTSQLLEIMLNKALKIRINLVI